MRVYVHMCVCVCLRVYSGLITGCAWCVRVRVSIEFFVLASVRTGVSVYVRSCASV